jgi:hypothetical protein
MDANIHLFAARTPETLLEFEGRYDALVLEAAQLALKYGLTSVFDTWGPVGPTTAVRERINNHSAQGSRIFHSGNIVGLNGPLSDDFFPAANFLEPESINRINEIWCHNVGRALMLLKADEVGDEVRKYISEYQVDFVKYAASDHGKEGFLIFSDLAQRRIVEATHAAGLTAQAHTTTVESLRQEIDAGADLLQHADITKDHEIPSELMKQIVDRRLPVAALFLTDEYLAWDKNSGRGAEGLGRDIADRNDRRLISEGARILLTTDAFAYGKRVRNHPGFRAWIRTDVPDMSTQIGDAHFLWIKAAFQKGMAPMEILRSATANTAQAYRVDSDLGTLEVGKFGDAVILDGDPLSSPENYRKIVAVVKGGVVVERESLAQTTLLAEDPNN